jgi:glutathione S-transferase
VKVTVMLEELLALGHSGAEYDAWLIRIGDGDQFGSGFVAVNPNSKIPALLDRSGPKPVRVFESGAILMYLAEKFGVFLPAETAARAECLSWLFWQMGSTPYVGGGFGHFYAYAPTKIEYPIDRFTMETKRLLDVLDKRLADNEYLGGRCIHDRRYSRMALVRRSGEVRAVRSNRVPGGARIQERHPLGRCNRRSAGGAARTHGQSHPGRTRQPVT